MGKLTRRRLVYRDRKLSLRKRITRFVRALFSSGTAEPWLDPPAGGIGVREPRRPLHPSASGAVALEAPPDEERDVWAVGDDDRG